MVSKRSGNRSFDRRTFIGAGMITGAGLALGGAPWRAIAQDRRLTTIGGAAKTQYGSVRGLVKDGVQQFWCVPYGAPTSGANRFMPPQKPASWTGVKDHFAQAMEGWKDFPALRDWLGKCKVAGVPAARIVSSLW